MYKRQALSVIFLHKGEFVSFLKFVYAVNWKQYKGESGGANLASHYEISNNGKGKQMSVHVFFMQEKLTSLVVC